MRAPKPTATATADLNAQVRSLSGFALGEPDATAAARAFAGFVTLLAEIDAEAPDQGNDNESNGSGHRLREAQGRVNRVRERRPG